MLLYICLCCVAGLMPKYSHNGCSRKTRDKERASFPLKSSHSCIFSCSPSLTTNIAWPSVDFDPFLWWTSDHGLRLQGFALPAQNTELVQIHRTYTLVSKQRSSSAPQGLIHCFSRFKAELWSSRYSKWGKNKKMKTLVKSTGLNVFVATPPIKILSQHSYHCNIYNPSD